MTEFLDFQTLRRPTSPNTALLAPSDLGLRAKPDGQAPVWAMAPDDLFANIEDHLRAQPRIRDLRTDPAGRRLAYVAVTGLMRFKDDVDIMVLPAGDGATLAAYSRSRVGYSDLGANARRLDELIQAISR